VPVAFRLPFSAASWLEIEGLLRARVEGESGREMLAAVGRTGPASSDSGTIRKPIGSLLVTVLLPWSRFGNPRAAAAPMDKSVVRLARRAAS
jgi:predicted secreted Zn-dependent protease